MACHRRWQRDRREAKGAATFWGGRFCKNALPRPLPKNSYMAEGHTNADVGATGESPTWKIFHGFAEFRMKRTSAGGSSSMDFRKSLINFIHLKAAGNIEAN